MTMLLSMVLSYLVLLTKMARCISMFDDQSRLMLMRMFSSLLIIVLSDDAVR